MRRRFTSRLRILVACALGAAAAASVALALVARGDAGGGPGGPDPNAPEGKAAVVQNLDEQWIKDRDRAKDRGKPADDQSQRPQPQADREPQAPGLVPVSSPFPSSQYLLDTTGWQQVSGQRVKVVYAGALAEDPAQGIIVVITANRAPANPSPGRDDQGVTMKSKVILIPGKTGPVELESAAGHMLTLMTSDGSRRVRFDAASDKLLTP